MPAWLYDSGNHGFLIFLLATGGLGGLAAIAAGRALAQTWRPFWMVPAYMVVLAAAVRFIHYAIFGETLLSLRSYLVDLAVLLILAALGYSVKRRGQMAVQYGWLAGVGRRS